MKTTLKKLLILLLSLLVVIPSYADTQGKIDTNLREIEKLKRSLDSSDATYILAGMQCSGYKRSSCDAVLNDTKNRIAVLERRVQKYQVKLQEEQASQTQNSQNSQYSQSEDKIVENVNLLTSDVETALKNIEDSKKFYAEDNCTESSNNPACKRYKEYIDGSQDIINEYLDEANNLKCPQNNTDCQKTLAQTQMKLKNTKQYSSTATGEQLPEVKVMEIELDSPYESKDDQKYVTETRIKKNITPSPKTSTCSAEERKRFDDAISKKWDTITKKGLEDTYTNEITKVLQKCTREDANEELMALTTEIQNISDVPQSDDQRQEEVETEETVQEQVASSESKYSSGPCIGIHIDECEYNKLGTTTQITIKPRNKKGSQYIFEQNGSGPLKPTAQTIQDLERSALPSFNSSKEALYWILGYHMNKSFKGHAYKQNVNESDTEYEGQSTFRRCQRALGANVKWEEIYNSTSLHNKMIESIAKATAYHGFKQNCNGDDGMANDVENSCAGAIMRDDEKVEILNSIRASAMASAKDCEVVARVLKVNFDEKRHKDSDYLNQSEKVSFDGRLKCYVQSVENVDYDECSDLINAYNAAAIGKQGLSVVQQVQTQDASFDANQKMQQAQFNTTTQIQNGTQENPMATQVNTQMLAYEVQKDMINKQKSQAQTRAAIDAAASAALIGFSKKMPDMSDLIRSCKNSNVESKDAVRMAHQKVTNHLGTYQSNFEGVPNQTSEDIEPNAFCSQRVQKMEQNFIPNQRITQSAYAIAAEYGVDAAKNSLSANMLKKRANLLSDMMDRINAMDINGEYAGLPQQDAIMKYCEAYPSSPQCAALGNGTSGTVLNPGGINVTGGDYGVNELGSFDVEDIDGGSAIDSSGDDLNEVYDGPTSKTIADVDRGGEGGAIAPTAKAGAAGPRSGGGGGGGSASAGSRNGSQDPGAQQGQPAAPNSGSGITGGYSKSNSSYLKGGGSIAGAAKKKVANPFAKLFKGNSAGKVLNFRNPASSIGKKSGNLFTRITQRYNVVNKKDRLLKYKLAPAK